MASVPIGVANDIKGVGLVPGNGRGGFAQVGIRKIRKFPPVKGFGSEFRNEAIEGRSVGRLDRGGDMTSDAMIDRVARGPIVRRWSVLQFGGAVRRGSSLSSEPAKSLF